jgi:putative ABC transport system permease protein
VVLVLDKNNQLSNLVLYILGVKDQSELPEIMEKLMLNQEYEDSSDETYTYGDFLGMTFQMLYPEQYYAQSDRTYTVDGVEYPIWEDLRTAEDYDQASFVTENGTPLKIVGIVRPNDQAASASIQGAIGYLPALTQQVIDRNNAGELVKQQKATPDYDLFTGLPFEKVEYTTANVDEFLATLDAGTKQTLVTYFSAMAGMPVTEQSLPYVLASMSEEDYAAFVANFQVETNATYESNLALLGGIDEAHPISINLYARDFASKDVLTDFIAEYNEAAADEDKIQYTDLMGIMMSSVTKIVDIISYVLIAFVSISLVVSSIMIGIITYISVLERTKEIGILRSIGASKRDITRVFNAETLLEGFGAGMIGILVTLLLNLPINLIIKGLSGIAGISTLPWAGAVILVLISMALTLVAGLVPARIAAKKDVVIALRTE